MNVRRIAVLALTFPLIGFAQPSPEMMQAMRKARTVLRALDANSDRKLSYEEVASAPEKLKTLDADSDGSEDYYSPFMSGLSRLPNGNVIFVSAPDKRIIEVTDSGERVEDYRLPRNGRMYRVYKYAKDYPGLKGRL